MNRLVPILLLALLSAFSGTARSYEIQLKGDIPLADSLIGISVNPATGIAAAVSSETKTLYLINTNSASFIKRIPLDITPSGVAIDAKRDIAILSSNDGKLQFVDLGSGIIAETISLGWAIHTIALDQEDDMLYIANTQALLIMDAETRNILKEAKLSDAVVGLGIDHNLGYIAVVTGGKGGVSFLDLGTLEPASGGNAPNPFLVENGKSGFAGIAINPSTHIAVLTNRDDSSISILSLENMALLAQVPLAGNPSVAAIDPTGNIALVAHDNGIAIITLENPVPGIDRLVPESSQSGSPGFTLSIEGSKFVRGSKASFNLKELSTLFGDNSNLTALVPSEELQSPGNVPVTVLNPQPGGGLSNSLSFTILSAVPQIESIMPDTVSLTNPSLSVRVRGKNFLPNAVVTLNGKNLSTKFISSILLDATPDFSDIKNAASYPVTVINPLPVSFTSNVVFLDVVEDAALLPAPISAAQKGKAATETQQSTGTLTGRILDTNKKAIKGVTVQIKNSKAVTDTDGHFTLNNVPSGKQHLMIHGSTVKEPDSHYPTIPLSVNISSDGTTEMPFQIYLHRQKNYNFQDINPSEDTVLTDPEYPGFELRIPKGVKITGWDGNANQKISVRTVPPDRLPVKPLPDNAHVRSVYMFYFDKIGGGIPDQPIPIKSRNDLGLLPGEKAVLWYYDESPNEGEAPNDWAIAGTGTVTPDGMYIVSDPGVGIPKFCCGATAWGWQGSGTPGGGDDGCHGGTCCMASGGDGGNSGPTLSGTAGDPVDLATGYFLHTKRDLYIPGGMPISFVRYYRSGDSNVGAFGRGTYFEYDWWLGDYGDMLLLVKPGNYQYRFVKQADGSYINTTDPAFRGAVIWNINNNPSQGKGLIMKNGLFYQFNGGGRLTLIADANSNSLSIDRYDELFGGYATKITGSGGTITFNQSYVGTEPTGFWRTDEIVDDTGRTVKYTYETDPFSQFPRLKTVTYPDGSSIQYEYDSAGRMSGIINEKGVREVFNEYDANNRVIRQTHSDGGTYTFNYSVAGGYNVATTMNLPNGGGTIWSFNNFGYIIDIAQLYSTPSYELYALNTSYERDPGTNKILSVTDPLVRKTTYTYDSNGNVLTSKDNAGNTTTYEYESTLNKVTKITDAMGNITTMTYDTYGNMLTRTGSDGKTMTFTYEYGKPLTVSDAMGNVTTMEYDISGNLAKVTNALGNFSTMTYYSLGMLDTVTNANGNTTSYLYDAMGRIVGTIDPLGSVTRYNYDITGKLIYVTDANNRTIGYDYDSRNRLIKMTDQLGNIETYAYDTSDNLTSVTDRKGQVTTFTYDLVNRLTLATYADGSTTGYNYDDGSRLTTITDSVSGTISYTYTGTGCGSGCRSIPDKVESETTPLGALNYSYDAIGRRVSMTVAGQPTVNYGYNAGGRLNDINTLIGGVTKHFTITYDDLGRRLSLTLPNGVTTNYTYDNVSHLLNVTDKNPAQQVLESLTYTYDAAGNRISMDRPSVTRPSPDQLSNTSYNDANQMLTLNGNNITYDANGNMTSVTNSCGTTTFTWDVRNRLVGISGFKPDCTALSASFMYDALGRRIEKTINGRTIQYLYDGLDIVQEKENGLPSVNYVRTLSIDEPLARIQANGIIRYFQTDALGSVIDLTDGTGAVKTTYSYEPFGNVTIAGEASDNTFQYTGRENDGTGLYYYRARYYSPELQRFISEDPIRLRGGINFFAYVRDNPVNRKDPKGLGHLVCGRDPQGRPGCEWVDDPPVPHWLCVLSIEVTCEVICAALSEGGGGELGCPLLCDEIVSRACHVKKCDDEKNYKYPPGYPPVGT